MDYKKIKNKIFKEPQIFKFKCIITYKGEYSNYDEYTIKSLFIY
jgi:hypothetical protein